MIKLLRGLLLFLFLSSVASCGFHLRGTSSEIRVSSLYLDAEIQDADLLSLLRQRLELAGVNMVSSQSDAQWTASLRNHQRNRRIASTNARITVERYELRQELELQISSADRIFSTETLVVMRTYDYDSSNLVGSDSEESLLTDEMQAELIDRIMRRLAFGTARKT